ncbi:vWA domain-containing protein [Seramator thermalis]|jgi:Ca-activated chloride channel family protein|uniref:vWA domain-containing protein n=1 Tax=Seramator thermalis TaxID=2496270 RepID=UPI00101BD7C0|nr:VWA domain-containing protein [Seramator thermalis]MBP7181008.1 VWA domain-containing protein [Dysgonamonadaceae bacterium]MDI3505717.1 Ca-activated chloride channel [Bacteroidota bacterium]MDK2837803.1 Ca-activated chloride channel [Bacteroidota bacterium]MDN5297173.1 Ca-activated chloride channel [Bacteroidota bacterium]HPD42886.1 VWA domain-containing protein [Dysgonamonadaceae bacterium]
MQFANPEYLYLLLLLIPLIAWYVVKLSKMQASFKLASTQAFKKVKPNMRVYMRHFPFVLRVISIALIIIVIARPQAVNSWEETESQGIDIVLALDVSGSMLAQDLQPNRIEAAKKVASEFVTDRKNDKIGLVIFAGESFTQCPLTTDHKVLLNLLKDVNFGMIEDGTAIGLGLANSVNRLKDSPSKSKVVILLTDGTNNRGQIAPLTAADLAKSYGIRVYTIGVGTKGMAPTPVQTPFGMRIQNMPVDIDEKTLTEIASLTGGQYFRAVDTEGLREVYREIDQMEKYLISVQNVTRKQELFLPFALAALALILIELILRRTWLRTIP